MNRRKITWYRRYHRRLGSLAAFFVLLLATTGIALNLGHAWKLDRKHVSWNWLLNYYGIEAPVPSGSFSTDGHRVTLLGEKLFFDRVEIAGDVERLAGLVIQNDLFVLGVNQGVMLVTSNGKLVDRIDLAGILPGPIERMGIGNGRAVIRSAEDDYIADTNLTEFIPLPEQKAIAIKWSDAIPVPAELLDDLQARYLARALTVERVLADLHSGRILGPAGAWFMDFIALCLIVLSATGLYQWWRIKRRR